MTRLFPTSRHLVFYAAAIGVLLLAWLAFITNLGLESMWYDENITWFIAAQPTLGDVLAQWPLGTGHPPASFVWTWAWVQWTGTQHLFVMRLAAVIPMLLAVAMCYRVGLAWFHSRWAALAAMLFLATSGLVIYYARELRMYSLMILLALVSWWLVRRFLDGHGRSRWLYAVVVALMAYTHYLSAFVVAVQAVAVLLLYRRRFLALLPAYALTALLVAPWLPIFITQTTEASIRAGRDGTLTLGNIGQFNVTEPTSPATIAEFATLYTAGQVAFVGLLVVTALVLGFSRTVTRRYRDNLILAALWLCLTVGLVWAVNPVVPVYSPRYVLPVLPALALLVGVAVQRLPRRLHLALVVLIGVSGLLSHTQAFRPPKIPHGDLLGVIHDGWLPGDRIWYNLSYGAFGSSTEEEMRYYLRVVYPDFELDDFIWDAPREFADPANRRIWDVRPYWIPMPAEAADPLNAARVETAWRRFGEYELRLYEMPPEGDAGMIGEQFEVKVGPMDKTYAPGDTVVPRLWLRAVAPVELDYSYSLQLRDATGVLVAQADAGLTIGEQPTSQWPVSDSFSPALPALTLPESLAPGDYTLSLVVYYWERPQDPLPVSSVGETNGSASLTIAEITVE